MFLRSLTTEAMGIWLITGAFAVVERQSESGEQNLRNARQPANEHRRVLASVFLSITNNLIDFNVSLFLKESSLR